MRRVLACVALLVSAAGCSGADSGAGTSQPAQSGDDGDASAGIEAGDDASIVDGGSDAEAGALAPPDASDAAAGDGDGGIEGGCEVFGAPGQCITTAACAALGDHSSYAGHCPGASSIECCIDTPDVADNPPVPAGWKLMQQSQVTPAMTAWAVMILNDPVTYSMYDAVTMVFGTLDVMARVEWHPPDFQNNTVHSGVTLYEPG